MTAALEWVCITACAPVFLQRKNRLWFLSVVYLYGLSLTVIVKKKKEKKKERKVSEHMPVPLRGWSYIKAEVGCEILL